VVVWARGTRHVRWSHRFPVALPAAYSTGRRAPDTPAQVEDLSREGLQMIVSEEPVAGQRLRIVLLFAEGPLEVTGVVVRADADHDPGTWSVGVAFDDLDASVADAIIEWCFRHPFGPEREVRVADLEGDRRRPALPAPAAAEPQPSRA
jgi:hypothetical protein